MAEAHCYYAGGVLVSNCEAGQYLMLGNGEGEAILMANPEETKADAAAYRQERALPTDDEDQARDFRRNRGLR